MTNDTPPDDRDDLPTDRAGGDRSRRGEPTASRGWLSTLLTALDRLDRAAGTERTDLDYSVSVRSGLGDLTGRDSDRDADRPAGRPQRDRTDRRSTSTDRPRRRRASTRREYASVRTYDDELLVTVELAGVDPEDVTVGFDGDVLVVGLEGRELERVYVPWSDRSAAATIHNDVLTVTVTPDSP